MGGVTVVLTSAIVSAKTTAERAAYVAVTVAACSFLLTYSERRSALRGSLYTARIASVQSHLDAAQKVILECRHVVKAIAVGDDAKVESAFDKLDVAQEEYQSAGAKHAVILSQQYVQQMADFIAAYLEFLRAVRPLGGKALDEDEIDAWLGRLVDAHWGLTLAGRVLLNVDVLHDGIQQAVYNMPFDPMKELKITEPRKPLRK